MSVKGYKAIDHPDMYRHAYGTKEGWNQHLRMGKDPCQQCVQWLIADLKRKRLRFLMRYLGNGRYA